MCNKSSLELDKEYLDAACKDPAQMERDFFAVVDYMKKSTAIHHNEYVRTCYKPKLFTAAQFAVFAADIRLLYGIFAKVTDAYFKQKDYRTLFGFDKRTEELILQGDPALSLLPMARIDFFYNEATSAYKYCEFNTDGSSAMNEDRELHRAQKLSAGYRAFTAAHKTHTCELFDSWVDTLLSIYRHAKGADAVPHVAIVDYMECGTVNEFEIFRQHFVAKGIPTEICDVRKLQYDGATLTAPSGNRIDAIYRRAVTSDVLAHYGQSGAMLQAAADGNVLLVGDFHTQLVHNKTIFRVLQAPETLALLNEEEKAFVAAHVPYTAAYTLADAEKVMREKDAWILKPLDSYGSQGVYAGVEYDHEEWRQVVANIPAEGYLLQEFYMPFVTENYGCLGEEFRKNWYYNLTGIYTYDGVAQGVYSRVSLSPIISSQYSEKTLPTLIVEE